MIQREIFDDVEPVRNYATRRTVSDAPAYEFDLSKMEIDPLQAGKTIVLLVGHDASDHTAIVVTRNVF